jgi:hypothetical protein
MKLTAPNAKNRKIGKFLSSCNGEKNQNWKKIKKDTSLDTNLEHTKKCKK